MKYQTTCIIITPSDNKSGGEYDKTKYQVPGNLNRGRTGGLATVSPQRKHRRIPDTPQLLLALDEIPANASWTDEKPGKACGAHIRAIGNLRKRFVEEGFEAALERKRRETPPSMIKIDGEAEAKIIALACSRPPEGRCRRTLPWYWRLVKKNGIKPWLQKEWCIARVL